MERKWDEVFGRPDWRGKKIEGWVEIGKMKEIGNTLIHNSDLNEEKETTCLICIYR